MFFYGFFFNKIGKIIIKTNHIVTHYISVTSVIVFHEKLHIINKMHNKLIESNWSIKLYYKYSYKTPILHSPSTW